MEAYLARSCGYLKNAKVILTKNRQPQGNPPLLSDILIKLAALKPR
jgi:hypothetical protein